jgi:hypothetical protein
MVNATPRPRYPPPRQKGPLPIVQEAGWTPGPFWTGAESVAVPGFDPGIVKPLASRYTD